MQASTNAERIRTKRKFCQFTRTASVIDLRKTEHEKRAEERKRQMQRYAERNGFAGKRAVFA